MPRHAMLKRRPTLEVSRLRTHHPVQLAFLGLITMLSTWFLLIGAFLLLMALTGTLLERLPISAAIIYFLIGVALGPYGVRLLTIDPIGNARTLELVAEIAVLISLFTVGLKLKVSVFDRVWRLPLRLAGQCGTVLEDMALMGFIASFRCWVSESQPSVFPGRARFQPVSRGDSCPQPLSHQLHPSAHFSLALRCSVSGYSRFKVTARSRFYPVP